MLHALQYGNATAYFTSGNPNQATANQLGLASGFAGKKSVSVYSVITQGGAPASVTARASAPSIAIIGRQGMRPVAFPLNTGWNFNAPGT